MAPVADATLAARAAAAAAQAAKPAAVAATAAVAAEADAAPAALANVADARAAVPHSPRFYPSWNAQTRAKRRRHLHPCSIKEDPHGHTPHFERRHILRHQRRHRPRRWNYIPYRGGRTLVNGTAFEVKFSSQQTWVINKDPKIPNSNVVPASFTSNGKKYLRFSWTGPTYRTLKYYYTSDGAGNDDVYDEGWWPLGEAYRTITFEEPPTGELLKLLQTIAVQQ